MISGTADGGPAVREGSSLGSTEKEWIARRIQQHGAALRAHPSWRGRLHDEIDILLWCYSVDDVVEGQIAKDAWVASGARLRDVHFSRVPHTADAWQRFCEGQRSQIRREHIVPRAYLRSIAVQVESTEDLVRVLDEYARVALVTSAEAKRLRPSSTMPRGWDDAVSWARPPLALPNRWARYRAATPPVCPRLIDGRSL